MNGFEFVSQKVWIKLMKLPSIIAGLVLVPFMQGCSDFAFIRGGLKPIAGSGTIITETREISDFDRVSVSGPGNLKLIQGDEESLTIVGDDNFMPLIRSEVSGGHLGLGPRNVSLRPTQAIQYTLKLKTLKKLDLSGSLRASGEEITAEDLEMGVSGSGRLRIENLEAGGISIRISGSGDVSLAGSVTEQNTRISGSGGYDGADLKSQKAVVSISGSGSVTLQVSEELDARISGSGSVKYHGTPKVMQQVSGSGKIRSLGER